MTREEGLLFRTLAMLEAEEIMRREGKECPYCKRSSLDPNRGLHHPRCEHMALRRELLVWLDEINTKYAALCKDDESEAERAEED